MKPAFSVVFLTTLSGAGQGLLIALFGVEMAARLGLSQITHAITWNGRASAVFAWRHCVTVANPADAAPSGQPAKVSNSPFLTPARNAPISARV